MRVLSQSVRDKTCNRTIISVNLGAIMQKPHYPHPIFAREGWPYMAAAIIVALVVTVIGGWWSLPFWIIALFVVQFFRDPPRHMPLQPNAVLSPADGRIVVVETTQDPYAQRQALKISVFMNVFN